MRELLDVLVETVRVQLLDGVDERPVECAPALAEKAAIRDLVREGVLERVLEVREQARLVQELRALESTEPLVQPILVEAGDREQQAERDALAHDGRRLEQAFVAGRQPVDPSGEDRLDRRRHADGVERPRNAIGAASTGEHTALGERPDAFLEEERVALRPIDQEPLEGCQTRVAAEQRIQETLGALRQEGSMRSWR